MSIGKCQYPYWLESQQIHVRCGKCILCRNQKRLEWAYRLQDHAYTRTQPLFVTLTYDKHHLPEFNTLLLEDLQNFWKRLRKNTGKKIQYYACGEYGGKNDRPHYHAIIFGLSMRDANIIFKTWGKCKELGYKIKPVKGIQGYLYTTGYINKKRYKSPKEYYTEFRHPEYQTSSNGLGKDYAKKYVDLRTGKMRRNGKDVIPPRYYRKILGLDASLYKEDIANYEKEVVKQIKKETPPDKQAEKIYSGLERIMSSSKNNQYRFGGELVTIDFYRHVIWHTSRTADRQWKKLEKQIEERRRSLI